MIAMAAAYFLDRVRGRGGAGTRAPSNCSAAARNANPAWDPVAKNWRPTPAVIAVRQEYKARISAENDVRRLRDLLSEFFEAEQTAWGDNTWDDRARAAFSRAARTVQSPITALAVIERLEANEF
jgi:hypothetical protein